MKDLPAEKRYNVFAGIKKYAEQIDRRFVMDAVLELLIMREKGETEFNGHIVIAENDPPRHVAFSPRSGEAGLRLIDGAGRTVTTIPDGTVFGISEAPGYIADYSKPSKVDDATQADYHNPLIDQLDLEMVGECCGDTARKHSLIFPYPCTVMGCNCKKWNSGE